MVRVVGDGFVVLFSVGCLCWQWWPSCGSVAGVTVYACGRGGARVLCVAGVVALSLLLAGCGSEQTTVEQPPAPAVAETNQAAVTPPSAVAPSVEVPQAVVGPPQAGKQLGNHIVYSEVHTTL